MKEQGKPYVPARPIFKEGAKKKLNIKPDLMSRLTEAISKPPPTQDIIAWGNLQRLSELKHIFPEFSIVFDMSPTAKSAFYSYSQRMNFEQVLAMVIVEQYKENRELRAKLKEAIENVGGLV